MGGLHKMKWSTTIRAATFAALLTIVGGGLIPRASAEDVTLTVWSHEADEPAKVAFRDQVASDLEKQHPGLHIKITWFEKDGLYTALRTALPAGRGPDVFYLEPDQLHQYVTAGYLLPLDDLVNWNQIYPWARAVWQENGKTWAFPRRSTITSFITIRIGQRNLASNYRLAASLARAHSSIW